MIASAPGPPEARVGDGTVSGFRRHLTARANAGPPQGEGPPRGAALPIERRCERAYLTPPPALTSPAPYASASGTGAPPRWQKPPGQGGPPRSPGERSVG